jgi:ketosteroid isomerase-like protein
MERANVDRWLNDYITAWKTYDPERIGALFSEDVEYRYRPADDPVIGREAVVEAWLGESDNPDASERDDEGIYDAEYRAVAVEGDTAVAVGVSTYTEGPGGPVAEVYDNCFLIRFNAEGRCREFTEWFVKRSEPSSP